MGSSWMHQRNPVDVEELTAAIRSCMKLARSKQFNPVGSVKRNGQFCHFYRSSSAWILSIFLPRTSTNWGSTCSGVAVAVTVGKVNLGKIWEWWLECVLKETLQNHALTPKESMDDTTQLERHHRTCIHHWGLPLTITTATAGCSNQGRCRITRIHDFGVKQRSILILARVGQWTPKILAIVKGKSFRYTLDLQIFLASTVKFPLRSVDSVWVLATSNVWSRTILISSSPWTALVRLAPLASAQAKAFSIICLILCGPPPTNEATLYMESINIASFHNMKDIVSKAMTSSNFPLFWDRGPCTNHHQLSRTEILSVSSLSEFPWLRRSRALPTCFWFAHLNF